MPLHRRLPKRGFFNLFRKENYVVQLGDIEKNIRLDKSKVINKEALLKAGLISKNRKQKVKILSNGELTSSIQIEVDAISKEAKKKVEKLKGSVTLIKK